MKRYLSRIIAGTLFAILLTGCRNDDPVSRYDLKQEVEIAPDKWLELDWHYQSSRFTFQWNGKKVGLDVKVTDDHSDTDERPISLREKNGTLYMIAFNRQDAKAMKFVYYVLNAKGDGFKEIKAKDYPRDIATQNMWLDGMGRARDINGNPIDELKILRELDVNSPFFERSYTVADLGCLELNMPYYEIDETLGDEELEKNTKEYAKKHKPIPLKNLIKSKATMP